MVNKVLIKETKNFIRKNIKTYIAQIIIVTLGVGFFVGMKISSLDLQDTMTEFVENNNFYDVKVNLEYGIEANDISQLKTTLEEVKYIEGAYTQDIVNNLDGEDYVIRLHSYNSKNKINTTKLIDGENPKNNNECVIDKKMYNDGYEIGDEITIESDLLKEKKLKIVGVIQSPEYLAIDRGNSTLLSGKINYYIFVNEANVNSDIYSDLYIKYDTNSVAFTEMYDDYIERKEIEATYAVSGYFKDKYNEIITDQQIKITSAKAEYEAEKAKIDAQFIEAENEIKNKEELLNDTKKNILTDKQIDQKINSISDSTRNEEKNKLNNLKKQMNNAKTAYDNYKKNYNNQISNTQKRINNNEQRIKELNTSINSNTAKLNAMKAQYNSMNDYTQGSTNKCYPGFSLSSDGKRCCYPGGFYCYNASFGYNGFFGGGTSPTINGEKVALKAEIDQLENTISNQKIEKASLETENISLRKQLTISSELSSYENKYLNAKKQYEEQLEIYNSMGSSSKLSSYYKKQNNELRKTVSQYEQEISAAKADLNNKKNAAYQQLEATRLEIQNGEDMIKTLSYPKSYVFDRKDNAGYGQFISDIEKISNLAIVVPVVFYFITFFMISASINRMLYEERNQIGTLKAIGIRDNEILIKYLIYSISSVIIGSFIGIIVGVVILPLFVYFIYEMLYEFPFYNLNFNFRYFLIASGIALVVAIASTLICCKETFKEKPVSLLKAKQEKETVSSIFEKIPKFWNHLSLTTKISLKNIFRYKARMLMTIIGIGGCLALMLTGLSLRTSITEMIPTQYGKIFKVDAQIFYKDLSSRESLNEGTEKILALDNVNKGLISNYETYTSDYNGKTININSVTFYDNNFSDFIDLRDYKTNKKLKLDDNGVIISEKLATMNNIRVGGVIKLKDKQQKEYSLIVKGIAKNYIEHYVYMNSNYYTKAFGQEPRNNMLLLKTKGNYDELELAQKINDTNIVSQVLYVSIAEKAYEDVMNNLALLVGVFVVFSILLIFAVLYNLININVRERSKEIATYKVLGFKNSKVISIIKRENIILMLFGIIFGLIAGYILSIIVIKTCEVENLNFIKEVTFNNCIISVIATIIFTLAFSMLINSYVKKINLTESLKSNE